MTRRPWFWIAFAALSALALAFGVANFTKSFAVVSLDVRMDRTQAVDAAKQLASRLGFGPGGAVRTASQFALDDTVKTFVELEGGGADAFRAMLRDHAYEAYVWKVRLFREGEAREAGVRFRPDGRPYGFVEHLREDAPGARLDVEAARAIAVASAAGDWNVDVSGWDALPASTEIRPGGRADHTFTYQRRDARLGEGRYRVRLVVSGDRLTELTQFLRVPEAFSRTYQKMRTSNDALSLAAQVLMVVLFLGGAVLGVFVLMRRRALAWTPALVAGFVIAGLQAVVQLGAFPLAWMGYDTAVSGATFVAQHVLLALLVFVADGSLVALTLAAAEGLGRRAFPDQPQLWTIASPAAVATRPVAGRVAGGTLLTGIEFGYVIGFYLLATRLWKWWVPAEALVDPNVLANLVPWLSSVAPSLHAGVWEEAMFRAVPLAGAALLGDRLGNRRLWIAIGLVTQALVFGGSHANYPSWPAYSRPLELIVPSLIWGAVYLRFGLVPSMIAHYLFDLALFSLPLFTTTAASARIDQVLVVVCGAAPLAWVAVQAMRRRGFAELPASARNAGWAAPADEPELTLVDAVTPATGWPASRTRALVALGLAALVAWVLFGRWSFDGPPLRTPRDRAVATGLAALHERGFTPDARWKRTVTVDDDGLEGEFAWQALGANVYRALSGRGLVPPHWELRYARFHAAPAAATAARARGAARDTARRAADADVAERAEEWRAWVTGDGRVWRARHVLPDARPGATLDAAAARALAAEELRRGFGIEPAHLAERSAVATPHPARTDWTFTFADTAAQPRLVKGGERRIAVEVAGDRVSDAHRFVFVPEDWQRAWRRTQDAVHVLSLVRGLFVGALVVTAAALGIAAWSRRAFPIGRASVYFVLSLVVGLARLLNQWPVLESRLSTAGAIEVQVGMLVVAVTLGQLVLGAVFALVTGWALGARTAATRVPAVAAAATAVIAAGAVAALGRLSPAAGPVLGDWPSAQAVLPWLDPALSAAGAVLMRSAMLLALFRLAALVRSRPLSWAMLFVVGGLLAGGTESNSIAGALAAAAFAGAGLVAFEALGLARDPRSVPLLVATTALLVAVRHFALPGFPGAAVAGVLELVAIAAVTSWWMAAARLHATAPAVATGVEARV